MELSRFKYDNFGLNIMRYLGIADTLQTARKENEVEKQELEKLDLKKIIQVDFPTNQYHRTVTKKDKIVLHHTVSGQGVDGDISWWLQTADRIATSVIIDWKGHIYQTFSTKYWAHHLGVYSWMFDKYGVKKSNNLDLNKNSIGIEIDAWGGLVEYAGKWYPAKLNQRTGKYEAMTTQKPIPKENVVLFPNSFRGFYGFEKYTDEQIESVRKLLVYWGEHYNIPLDYNEDMWDISPRALSGESGIWTHTAFREDKSDCYPDERLIEMLKSLK